MPFSTAQQLRGTYMLWKRFSFPTEDGRQHDAWAVPKVVGDQLNSAYAIMITSLMVNLWAIIIAFGIWLMLEKEEAKRKGKETNPKNGEPTFKDEESQGSAGTKSKLRPVTTRLYNKRDSLLDTFLDMVLFAKDNLREWWIYPLMVLALFCWIAQTALGIVIPPYISIGAGAPVNPDVVFVPQYLNFAPQTIAKVFAMEVPSALRAVGGAEVATKDEKANVFVSPPVILGTTSTGENIMRVDYGYNVSGADFGLQRYPDLFLNVTGSCYTEYSWFLGSEQLATAATPIVYDEYAPFDTVNKSEVKFLSVMDGTAPAGYFIPNTGLSTSPAPGSTVGQLAPGNVTWAALVSSVARNSFTPGTDPWYLTDNVAGTGAAGAGHTVRSGRPALSCWQQDVWRYRGASSTVDNLTSAALPGLDLPEFMQLVFPHYLGVPRIVPLATRLSTSALLSSTTALGTFFDAEESSFARDLERLVLAAYIATTNTLTDTTLFGTDGVVSAAVGNVAFNDRQLMRDGVGDFVVYSPDIVTLSVKALIIIPVVFLCFMLITLVLLHLTPIRSVQALDVELMSEKLYDNFPDARPGHDGNKPIWIGLTSHSEAKPEVKRSASEPAPQGLTPLTKKETTVTKVRTEELDGPITP